VADKNEALNQSHEVSIFSLTNRFHPLPFPSPATQLEWGKLLNQKKWQTLLQLQNFGKE